MSAGVIILMIAILIFFVFEVGSLIGTIVKKRKAKKKAQSVNPVSEVNENKSNEEVKATDDRCTDNAVDN